MFTTKLAEKKIKTIIADYQEDSGRAYRQLLSGKISLYGWSNRMADNFRTMSEDIRVVYEYGDTDIIAYMAQVEKITDIHTKQMRKMFLDYKKRFG